MRKRPLLVEQRIVFHLIAEHRRVAPVELKLDALRQDRREIGDQAFLVGLGLHAFRRHEIDAVGIDLDDLGAGCL